MRADELADRYERETFRSACIKAVSAALSLQSKYRGNETYCHRCACPTYGSTLPNPAVFRWARRPVCPLPMRPVEARL